MRTHRVTDPSLMLPKSAKATSSGCAVVGYVVTSACSAPFALARASRSLVGRRHRAAPSRHSSPFSVHIHAPEPRLIIQLALCLDLLVQTEHLSFLRLTTIPHGAPLMLPTPLSSMSTFASAGAPGLARARRALPRLWSRREERPEGRGSCCYQGSPIGDDGLLEQGVGVVNHGLVCSEKVRVYGREDT